MPLQAKNYDPALMQGASIDINLDLGEILDPAGNEMLEFDQVASAVNFARLANSATGNPVVFSSQGDDTNVGLDLDPKGTGALRVLSGATTGNAVDIISGSVTTGKVLDLSDADALTTGAIAEFTSNSSSGSTRSLVLIKQDHASATGATALELQQDAAATWALKLSGNAAQYGLDLSNVSGTNRVLKFTATGNTPVAASATTANTGWMLVDVAGTNRYIPFYI